MAQITEGEKPPPLDKGLLDKDIHKTYEDATQIHSLSGPAVIRDVNTEFEGKLSFGQRLADIIAATMGSWRFIIIQSCLLLTWIILNVTGVIGSWDPYPFILLNLALSFQAAYAAPVIMMSQNRQSQRDRLVAQNDFEVNKLGEIEVQAILLHLEQQDRLIIQLLQRFDRMAQHIGQSPSSIESGYDAATMPLDAGKKLGEEHRQRIENDMNNTVAVELQEPVITSQTVRDHMCQCYALVNIESFQRDNLLTTNYQPDPHQLAVLRILYKEAFISLGANFDEPDVEDLNQVKNLLIERMQYRGLDGELIIKYNEICQQLIAKVKDPQ